MDPSIGGKKQKLTSFLRRDPEPSPPDRSTLARQSFRTETVQFLDSIAIEIFGSDEIDDRRYAEALVYIEAHAELGLLPPNYETVQAWLSAQTPAVRGKVAEFLAKLQPTGAPAEPESTTVESASLKSRPDPVETPHRQDAESLSHFARRTVAETARDLLVNGRTRGQRVVLRVDADRDGQISLDEMHDALTAALRLMDGTEAATILTVNRAGHLVLREGAGHAHALAFGAAHRSYLAGADLRATRNTYLALGAAAKRDGDISDAKRAANAMTQAAAAGRKGELVKHASDYVGAMKTLDAPANALAHAELALAEAHLAAGAPAKAEAGLERARLLAPPAMENAMLLTEARIDMARGRLVSAIRTLGVLADTASPELSANATALIVSVEQSFLAGAQSTVNIEIDALAEIHAAKTPGHALSLLNPWTSAKLLTGQWDAWLGAHQEAADTLTEMRAALSDLRMLSTRSGTSIRELHRMDSEFRMGVVRNAYPGLDTRALAGIACSIDLALTHPDVVRIAQRKLGPGFSWDTGQSLIDLGQFDTEQDVIIGKVAGVAGGIGAFMRAVRRGSEEATQRSWLVAGFGHASGAALDALSLANRFTREQLESATRFHAQNSNQGGALGAASRVAGGAVWVGEALLTPAIAAVTVVDPKVTDEERTEALIGVGLMAASLGVMRAANTAPQLQTVAKLARQNRIAGPMLQRLEGIAGRVSERVARADAALTASRLGQTFDRVRARLRRPGGRVSLKSSDDPVSASLDDLAPTGATLRSPTRAEVTAVRDTGETVVTSGTRRGGTSKGATPTEDLVRTHPGLVPEGAPLRVKVGEKSVSGRVERVSAERIRIRYRSAANESATAEIPLSEALKANRSASLPAPRPAPTPATKPARYRDATEGLATKKPATQRLGSAPPKRATKPRDFDAPARDPRGTDRLGLWEGDDIAELPVRSSSAGLRGPAPKPAASAPRGPKAKNLDPLAGLDAPLRSGPGVGRRK